MVTNKSEYDVQAETWAAKYSVTMTATFAGHRKYFADDKDTRDTYRITLTRVFPSPHAAEKGAPVTRTMSFDYGASLVGSRREDTSDGPYWRKAQNDVEAGRVKAWRLPNRKRVAPSLYDIITCIEKYDPGTFEQWAGDFGYDTDSRKALETYLACQKQYRDFAAICNGSEEMMREAQDIQ